MNEQKAKAETFLALHRKPEPLVLPNVWNPIGARVLASLGYPAIATASAAIAESLGYLDGENVQFESMREMLFRIARSVAVPVSADIESGYSETLDVLKETVARILQTGVVGINIEDSIVEGGALRSIGEQSARIAAIRRVAESLDVHLVINARVDSFLTSGSTLEKDPIEDAVTRSAAYIKAGADCIYPIGPGDVHTLRVLREHIAGPLNALAGPGKASLSELKAIGFNRVSFGPHVFRTCLSRFVEIAEEVKASGTYECINRNALSRSDVRKYLIEGRETERS
jgi:2-methylisocitrate lyase-like PEP mutase family enzyme